MSAPAQSPGPDQGTKVPIPRLKRKSEDERVRTNRTDRVSRACLSCRDRKVKCDGATPRCGNCIDKPESCFYMQHRKDRLKIQTEVNQKMIEYLRDLQSRVGEDERGRIDVLLGSVEAVVSETAASLAMAPISPSAERQHRGLPNLPSVPESSQPEDIVMREGESPVAGFGEEALEAQWGPPLEQGMGSGPDYFQPDFAGYASPYASAAVPYPARSLLANTAAPTPDALPYNDTYGAAFPTATGQRQLMPSAYMWPAPAFEPAGAPSQFGTDPGPGRGRHRNPTTAAQAPSSRRASTDHTNIDPDPNIMQ